MLVGNSRSFSIRNITRSRHHARTHPWYYRDREKSSTFRVEMQYFASQPDSPNDGRNTNDERDPINATDQNLPQPKNPFKFTPQPQFHKTKFGPQSQNLGSIIRGFKVGVTKNVRKKNPNFSWQKDYHDRIIMDQKAFDNISRYIINNPKNYKG